MTGVRDSWIDRFQNLNSGTGAYIFSQSDGVFSESVYSDDFKNYRAILPPCDSAIQIDCIISVESRTRDEILWHKGVLSKKQLPLGLNCLKERSPLYELYSGAFKGDEVANRPNGAAVSPTYALSSNSHLGGSDYLVTVVYNHLESNVLPLIGGLTFSIRPIVVGLNNKNIALDDCDFGTFDRNAIEYHFPKDVEFRLQINTRTFKQNLHGFYSGPISQPNLNLEGDIFQISGFTQKSLSIGGVISCSENLIALQSTGLSSLAKNCSQVIHRINPLPGGQEIQIFKALESLVHPLFNEENWGFNFQTKPIQVIDRCRTITPNSVLGYVVSNATVFDADPPTWNQSSGTFDYTIGGAHFDLEGKLNQGSYDFTISEEVAACIWGVNSANASAEIQVVNENGTPSVSTISLVRSNGEIYFHVSGFSYSIHKIKIKLVSKQTLSTDQIPTITPTPPATDTPIIKKVVQKRTIKCFKGKILKKVSAINPKCPSGYKLKV